MSGDAADIAKNATKRTPAGDSGEGNDIDTGKNDAREKAEQASNKTEFKERLEHVSASKEAEESASVVFSSTNLNGRNTPTSMTHTCPHETRSDYCNPPGDVDMAF